MKLSHLVYAGAGYVLGARAGRERYEQIVRVSRRIAGSQTLQSTAGVVQAQVDQFTAHARHAVGQALTGSPAHAPENRYGDTNGYRREA